MDQSDLDLLNFENDKYMDYQNTFIEVMACCHSLTLVNNELMGDPLEIEMFIKSGWIMIDNN